MPVKLKAKDVNDLVAILAELAASTPAGPERYLRDLVMRADIPDRFKTQLAGGWTGDSNIDARTLVNWAVARETLGNILKELLDDVGCENYAIVVAVIVAYSLYGDKASLARLKMRYLVPDLSAETGQVAEIGPPINWRGPTDELELQGLRQPPPDLLDVGFLKGALEATAAVCRIETTKKVNLGTGFLVAPGLVLTNYHVLSQLGDPDIEKSAQGLLLHFGAITDKTASESAGQTFRTNAGKAVLKSSPIDRLDYALLQVEDAIGKADGLKPVKFDLSLPGKGMGLHILQHPEGESMKIAISNNGITGVYDDVGLVQYVTNTKPGSSGSPCFNDGWMLTALHHAQRSKIFGTIREGILFRAIHSEIAGHLSED